MIRIDEECSEPSQIGCGVRQGCCLSPLLLSIYTEMMMTEGLEDTEEGVKVGGRLLKEVRFADDQGITSSTEVGLQKVMDGLVRAAKEYNMKMNVKKTKVMKVGRKMVEQRTFSLKEGSWNKFPNSNTLDVESQKMVELRQKLKQE